MNLIMLDEDTFINIQALSVVTKEHVLAVGDIDCKVLKLHLTTGQTYEVSSDWDDILKGKVSQGLSYTQFRVTPERMQAIEQLLNSQSV